MNSLKWLYRKAMNSTVKTDIDKEMIHNYWDRVIEKKATDYQPTLNEDNKVPTYK
jgi:hypothetical protein